MGYDLGSWIGGAGRSLFEGLTGARQDGFYRNTVDPSTNQLFGVDSSGKRFAIPQSQWTQDQTALFANARRKYEEGRLKKDAIEAANLQTRNLLTVIGKQQQPVFAQMRDESALRGQQLQLQGQQLQLQGQQLASQIQGADADRQFLREQLFRRDFNEAAERGLKSEEARNAYALGQQRLRLEERNLENANIARINQQSLDQHAIKMQSIQSAIALMARGIAGAF